MAMKKLVGAITALSLVGGYAAMAEENDKVEITFKVGDSVLTVNGAPLEVTAPYVVGDGTTLVPVRVITEAFGAEVIWNGEDQSVNLKYPDVDIAIKIGSKSATVNTHTEELLAAPELYMDTTMVPLRFISETFGATVSYDDGLIRVTTKKAEVGATVDDMSLIIENKIKNGNFDNTDSWTVLNGSLAVEDNIAVVTPTKTNENVGIKQVLSDTGNVEIEGNVWYVQANVKAKRGVGGSTQQNIAYAMARINTGGGLLYAFKEPLPNNGKHTYYGNFTFNSTNLAAKTEIQLIVQYNNTAYMPDSNVEFDKVICLNLTDIFGSGNEPTADEVHTLLNGFDDNWFDGTVNAFSSTANLKRYNDIENKTIKDDTVVTVGAGGDFESLNDALEYLSQFYPTYKNGGLNCEVKILSGTTITEQISVVQIDMQYITITSEDDIVPVDSTDWTTNGLDAHDLRGDVAFIGGENAAKLPTIGTIFKLVTVGEKGAVGYFANRGSEGIVLSGCGFDGFYDGVIANNESTITIREGISRNMTRWGVHARHNGEISARSVTATNCGIGAYADRVADLDVREADLSGCKQAIYGENTSRINANGCHADSCGSDEGYTVLSGNGSIVNCTGLEVTNSAGDVFGVTNGGTIIACSATTTGIASDKSVYSQEVNTVTASGIIYR